MSRYALIAVAVVLLLWGRTAFYAVDQAEFAYVTRFGEPVALRDGATDAGLHLKLPWPVDAVQTIDRRVQTVDLPAVEVLTRDRARDSVFQQSVGTTLTVDATVTWRVPTAAAADQFFRTVRTPEQANRILTPQVNGRLSAVVSAVPIESLIDVADVQAAAAGALGAAAVVTAEPAFRAADYRQIDDRVERVRRRLTGTDGLHGGLPSEAENLRGALAEYGIEVIDIRVRRFSYPEAVRAKIAELIRSEREKKAADYESEGRRRAAEITADADRQARVTEADARARKTEVEGKANADAARTRAAAYAQDREFYLFLESLRAFQGILSGTRDVLLLSTKHPLLKPLAGPPAPKP
jgi:membrane protease subunit HflC